MLTEGLIKALTHYINYLKQEFTYTILFYENRPESPIETPPVKTNHRFVDKQFQSIMFI